MTKKVSLGDYLLYWTAKAIGALFRAMPIAVTLFIGRRFGEFSMLLNRKRRRIAYANLKAAFAHKYSPQQLRRILKRTYANLGQGVVEVLLLPKIDKRYLDKNVRYRGFHIADEALAKGKGFIFLTAHFGTWEMSHVALPHIGFRYTGIAREQKPYVLDKLLNSYREIGGCKIITKGLGVKEALKALKSNGIAGMLVDQDAGKAGVFVKLFNRRASWNPGVMEIALKTGAAILPGFVNRQKGGRLLFRVFEPIALSKEGGKKAIEDGFKQYVKRLEYMIEKYPDQWLWQHRRWKSTPERKILILNDNRTGHLRQSQAVANKIRDIWEKRGYSRDDAEIKILDVEFKNNLCKQLLSVAAKCPHYNCQGCMRCLRLCLKKRAYQELIENYADIIISCGSMTAGVNLILSRENNAKSIVIMKPPILGINGFNLAILPRHDNPLPEKNVVVTDGALNLIDKKELKGHARALRERIGELKPRVIGILIGGSTRDFVLDVKGVDLLLDNISEACVKHNADMLVTTSRRTSLVVEKSVRTKLENNIFCKLLVSTGENNFEKAIESILGLADIVVVTPDSISMVSEAASSGAYTIVIKQRGYPSIKHERFLRSMAKNNFIKLVDPQDILSAVSYAFENAPRQNTLMDSEKIEDALERLL